MIGALEYFDRQELFGDANGRGQSIRVIRRGKPLLFGPKSTSPVKFPGGMFDRDLDRIGIFIRQGLTTADVHRKTGATFKRIRRLRAVIKGTMGKEFRTKWLHRTDEEKAKSGKQVRRMIRQGYTDTQIFDALNIPSVPFVIRQRRLMGDPKPTRKAWHTRHANAVIKCLRTGMSIMKSETESGASRATVRRIKAYLEAHGESFQCKCGRPTSHKGPCPFRPRESKQQKLTPADVRQIRRLYRPRTDRKGYKGYAVLAKRFGVGGTTIQRIIEGRSWTHVK